MARRPVAGIRPDLVVTLFLDFDGTVTTTDATDAILDAFADPSWREVEAAWRDGRIGSRECLARQMALVRASPADIDALLDGIAIDDGFAALLDLQDASRLAIHIVSDGFDYCIRRIVGQRPLGGNAPLARVRVVASHLEPSNDRGWRVAFPEFPDGCAHGCATCKPAAMAALAETGAPTIFVGDGLSDRYAATWADVLFAKDALAAYCTAHAISYTPFDTLADVAREVERLSRGPEPLEVIRPL